MSQPCYTLDELRAWAHMITCAQQLLDDHRLWFLETGNEAYLSLRTAELQAQQALCCSLLNCSCT